MTALTITIAALALCLAMAGYLLRSPLAIACGAASFPAVAAGFMTDLETIKDSPSVAGFLLAASLFAGGLAWSIAERKLSKRAQQARG